MAPSNSLRRPGPDKRIDLRDVLAAVTGFEHTGYPFGSPCATVSTTADHKDLAAAVVEGQAVLFAKVVPGDVVPGGAVDVEVFIEVQDPDVVVELSSYQITLEVIETSPRNRFPAPLEAGQAMPAPIQEYSTLTEPDR